MTTAITISLEDQKKAFALALLKNPEKPFEAASSVIADIGIALMAATLWVNDPLVKQHQLDMLEQFGMDKFLPTEVDQLKDIYKMATNEKLDEEVRLKAHELYAKIKQRYFQKPDSMGPIGIVAQNVMIVRDKGTPEEWERGCIEQQEKLVRRAN